MVSMAKATPVIVQTRWKLTPELLKANITPKTRVLILNNGCNPTGVLYSQEEIGELLRIASEANLFVISDEVYSELVFDAAEYVSSASFPEYRANVLIIESCSKNFAMAGWRVGFAFGPKELIAQIIALQSQSTTGTSYISQKVALVALQNSKEITSYVREAMGKRRTVFFDTYNRLFGTHIKPPPSALYYFAKMDNVEEILNKAPVALVPGIAFGVEGYARFAYSESEEEIIQGLEALHSKI
jgi:aspartate/methionine/tyrosine aminotransferase